MVNGRRMELQLEDFSTEQAEQAARVIRKGGIVLHPSDTVYGLGCSPFDPAALERLLQIKGRRQEKGLLVLIPDRDWVGKLARECPFLTAPTLERFWPGPLTILLPARSELSPLLTGNERKIGIREPAGRFLKDWLKRIPGPVVSTSANRSGFPAPETVKGLEETFGPLVDLIIDAGPLRPGPPSTVLDLTCVPPKILRRGRLAQELEKFLLETERVRE